MFVQLVVATGSRAGQVIPVAVKKFIIGRAADCHLKSKNELVSRYHCAILVGDDEVIIRDLGSRNGIRLNGEKVDVEQKLKHGDHIAVGPLEFNVHIGTDGTDQRDTANAIKQQSGKQQPGHGESSDVCQFDSTIIMQELKPSDPETK